MFAITLHKKACSMFISSNISVPYFIMLDRHTTAAASPDEEDPATSASLTASFDSDIASTYYPAVFVHEGNLLVCGGRKPIGNPYASK